MIQTFLNWLIYSSENPDQFSLTVKGLLLTNSVLILAGIKLATGVDLPEEGYVELVGMAVGSFGLLLTSFGLLRKFWNLGKSYFKKS